MKRADDGEGAFAPGRVYNPGESTIRNIVKSADKFRAAVIQSSSLSSKIATKVRNHILEKMDKLMVMYIDHENMKKSCVLNATVRCQALRIYERLCHEAGDDAPVEAFLASKGWFARYMKRNTFHNLAIRGEQASADHDGVARYPAELQQIIEELGVTRKVFIADETGLFWKPMPRRT